MSEEMMNRVMKALGWTEQEVKSFSLAMLVEILRTNHQELSREIRTLIDSGEHLFVKEKKKSRRN